MNSDSIGSHRQVSGAQTPLPSATSPAKKEQKSIGETTKAMVKGAIDTLRGKQTSVVTTSKRDVGNGHGPEDAVKAENNASKFNTLVKGVRNQISKMATKQKTSLPDFETAENKETQIVEKSVVGKLEGALEELKFSATVNKKDVFSKDVLPSINEGIAKLKSNPLMKPEDKKEILENISKKIDAYLSKRETSSKKETLNKLKETLSEEVTKIKKQMILKELSQETTGAKISSEPSYKFAEAVKNDAETKKLKEFIESSGVSPAALIKHLATGDKQKKANAMAYFLVNQEDLNSDGKRLMHEALKLISTSSDIAPIVNSTLRMSEGKFPQIFKSRLPHLIGVKGQGYLRGSGFDEALFSAFLGQTLTPHYKGVFVKLIKNAIEDPAFPRFKGKLEDLDPESKSKLDDAIKSSTTQLFSDLIALMRDNPNALPAEVKEVMTALYEKSNDILGGNENAKKIQIVSSFFLKFLTPIITTSTVKLDITDPDRNNIMLISKVVQKIVQQAEGKRDEVVLKSLNDNFIFSKSSKQYIEDFSSLLIIK